MAPQLSQCSTSPSGPPLRMRSTSVAGIVSRHPWHVLPTSRATPDPARRGTQPLVEREQRRPGSPPRRPRGPRSRARSRRRSTASCSATAARAVVGLGLGRADPLRELAELGVDRLLALHELELAVLERPLVPPELLDLALHRLELTRRA